MSSLIKMPFSDSNFKELKQKQIKNNKNNFVLLTIVLLFYGINFFVLNKISSERLYFAIKIFLLISFGIIIIKSLAENLYNLDLNDQNKYVGVLKVKNKIYIKVDEQLPQYKIEFEDWRINAVYFHKQFWDRIRENDEFYIEQAINSEYIFVLKKEDEDFTKGIKRI